MNSHPFSPDFAVREIESTSPRIREGLRWTFQETGGDGGYLLEDPLHGRFFRLGRREHHFVKSLDGRRTIAQIVAALAAGDRDLALDASEATSLVRMLIDNGLVVSHDGAHADRVWDEVNRPQESKRMLGRLGQLMFVKIPLGNPDRFFLWLSRKAGWLAGPGFFLVWLVFLIWGVLAVTDQGDRFRSQMAGVFDFGNIWILGGLWILLKVFHECWHGLVCRRLGGVVPEAGVTLLLVTTPLGYVNASSSTAFPSKWQRIAVSGAGMYGELFVAAVAAILWSRLEPGPLSAALHQVVVLSSITTVLFNANPLMRFDGYYILSDLLGIPNLFGKGQSALQWLLRRWILGQKKARSPFRPNDPRALITVYGIVAGVWKILVTVGLLLAASVLFEGIGLLLAMVVGATLVIQGARGATNYLRKSAAAEGLRPARLMLRVGLLVGILISALCLLRVTPTASAPAVVRDASGGEIRAECPGFLVEIAAPHGAKVKAGDLLIRLENAQETSRLRILETEIAISRLRCEQHLAADRLAAWQSESSHLAALESTAAELRAHTASLERRAPRAGIVQSRNLASLEKTWIEPGQLLMTIGSPECKELVILTTQKDWQTFQDAQAAGRQVRYWPRGRLQNHDATLREVVPSATSSPSHFALIAPAGGPLAVRKKADSDPNADFTTSSAAADRYDLTQPRFEIKADLEASQAGRLIDGEIGLVVASRSEPATLASLALEFLRRKFDSLMEARFAS